jgi:hypothetical protein
VIAAAITTATRMIPRLMRTLACDIFASWREAMSRIRKRKSETPCEPLHARMKIKH